ncbi:MAG: hypothetical protein ACR2NY_03915 [Alphaproteobacteria bacterium]
MYKIKYLPWLLLLSMLASCASRANYNDMMRSLVGKKPSAVINALGPPSREYRLEGRVYMVYRRAELGVAGAGVVVTGEDKGSVFREGALGQTYYKKWCQTTFIIKNNRVESFQGKGNHCRL